MTLRPRLHACLSPPEPLRALSSHVVRAASELHPLPGWVERYSLAAMSPAARQVSWSAARRLTQNPDHGFAMATRVPAEAVGSLWALSEAAPSLATLHERYASFCALLLDDMDCSIERTPASIRLHHRPQGALVVDRAAQDFRVAMQVKTWRRLHRDQALCPLSVHFTYPRPHSTRAHERALGTADLLFGQPFLQLQLSAAWWDAPLPTANRQQFEQRVGDACESVRLLEEQPLGELVEARLIELLSQDPTATAVARTLGIGTRTLRRRLEQSGHSFQRLLQGIKQREAELFSEIEQLGVPLSSRLLAGLLGFANVGAWRNARRRWSARVTGQN